MADLPTDESMEVIIRSSDSSDNELIIDKYGSALTSINTEPTFMCVFPYAGYGVFAANRQQAIIYNTLSTHIVKIRKVIYLPDAVARTGALSGLWYVWRRVNPTTPPAGTVEPVAPHDTAYSLPSGIYTYSNPSTPANGGTLQTFTVFVPQPDEIKLTTLDAPTMSSLLDGCGTTIYDANWGGPGTSPITIRQNQTFEIVQTATSGTGYFRLLIIFSVREL